MNKQSRTQQDSAFFSLPETKSPSDRYAMHLEALSAIKTLASSTHDQREVTKFYSEILRKKDPVLLTLFYKHYQIPTGRVLYPGSAKQTILTTEKNLAHFRITKYGAYYRFKIGAVIGGIAAVGLTGYVLRWAHYMRHSYDLFRPDMDYLENRF